MQLPANLYILTRPNNKCMPSTFSRFERLLSKREEIVEFSDHEIASLDAFVSLISEHPRFSIGLLDGFVFSYSIPHIGKEFDLLMISSDSIVNIELKSKRVSDDKKCAQLARNNYYLSFIEGKKIELFTFTAESGDLEKYSNGSIVSCEMDVLIETLLLARDRFSGDYDEIFREKKYLVSPVNDVSRFMSGGYFLTQQQQEIKIGILRKNSEGALRGAAYKITGTAGTGKTLLLYDLAKSLVGELPSCVIHCGQLSEGHRLLNSSQSSFSVVPAKGCEKIALEDYGAIFIDECHRLRLHQFNEVVRRIKETELPCFFFLDSNQTMQASEIRNEISSKIIETMPNAICKELSKKIRTNKEIAAFVRRLFSLKSESNQIRFENIEVLYAGEILEAGKIIESYKANGYQYIYYTPSQYKKWNSDIWVHISEGYSTHDVIGQEFDRVIIPMDKNFFFENGKLKSYAHPYREYILPKMLFQGLTRTRERLAILVYDNPPLFEELLSIAMNPAAVDE